jgi:hypothetical protein
MMRAADRATARRADFSRRPAALHTCGPLRRSTRDDASDPATARTLAGMDDLTLAAEKINACDGMRWSRWPHAIPSAVTSGH